MKKFKEGSRFMVTLVKNFPRTKSNLPKRKSDLNDDNIIVADQNIDDVLGLIKRQIRGRKKGSNKKRHRPRG